MCKQCQAHAMLRASPEEWFRDEPIEDRDLALFAAEQVPFADYTKGCYLKKVVRI